MAVQTARYQRWEGRPLGIWRRRAVIAECGIRLALQNKWMRYLMALAWGSSLAMAALMFLVGQLLVTGSFLSTLIDSTENTTIRLFGKAFIAWLEQHPEISVRTTERLLFFFYSTKLLLLSFVAIAIAIPNLVTKDLSSNAIVIYTSKAVGRADYLLGKFGAVFGLLTLTWLGPMLTAWFAGNLLSPHWHYFWHSKLALASVLAYAVFTMSALSLLAVGVSAVSSKEKWTVGLWLGLWLFTRALVPLGELTKPWLKYLSFSHDFEQLGIAIFQPGKELELAKNNIPMLVNMLPTNRHGDWFMHWLNNPGTTGAILGLSAMAGLALFVALKRSRPQ